MAFVTLIIFLAIILAFCDDKKIINRGYYYSFWLIVITFSLRYGYGNDYFNYEKIFIEINNYSNLLQATHHTRYEIGWIFLCKLMGGLGFRSILCLCTFILCFIYYYIVDKYVSKPYRWFGILIFLMHPNIFLLNLSMLRQGLACALFFWAICEGIEGKKYCSLILYFIAISFHQTALICFPFILMIILKKYLNPKLLQILILLIFAAFYFIPKIGNNIFDVLVTSNNVNELYSNYFTRSGVSNFGFGVIIQFIIILPSLIFYKSLKLFDKYMTIMYCMILLVILLSIQNTMILRMESYFLPFTCLLYPRLLNSKSAFINTSELRNKRFLFISAWFGYMVYIFYSFFSFFSSPTYEKSYNTFHTILST